MKKRTFIYARKNINYGNDQLHKEYQTQIHLKEQDESKKQMIQCLARVLVELMKQNQAEVVYESGFTE